MPTKFQNARRKYRPKKIKCLLIAESPPDITSKRFFYFEKYFSRGDSLFMETMKALFPDDTFSGGDYKRSKEIYLKKFMNAGLYLEDASSIPFPKGSSKPFKRKMLQGQLPPLKEKLLTLIDHSIPIILISDTVFEICYDSLKKEGYNILNDKVIFFPISFQPQYREALKANVDKACINLNPEELNNKTDKELQEE